MTLIWFLALTFAISLTGFAFVLALPAARSPENLAGLPFWLLMVWGPTIAAMTLSARSGELAFLLSRAVKVSSVPVSAWLLVLAPVAILLWLRQIAPDAPTKLGPGLLAGLIAFNLILGPLGEELGWRGVMQDHLNQQIGWLEASLLIGAVWFAWHLPLWTLDTPHAQIALPIFGIHVMLYSVIIGAAYTISNGSILPAILIHLTVNLAANLAVFAGFRDPNAWFTASLLPYLALASAAVAMVYVRTGAIGLRWVHM